MVLIIATRIFYMFLFHAIKMFGSFAISAFFEAIMNMLEDWSIERAKKSQPVVIIQ